MRNAYADSDSYTDSDANSERYINTRKGSNANVPGFKGCEGSVDRHGWKYSNSDDEFLWRLFIY